MCIHIYAHIHIHLHRSSVPPSWRECPAFFVSFVSSIFSLFGFQSWFIKMYIDTQIQQYVYIYIYIYIYNNIHTYTWTYTLVSCRKCPAFWISFVSSHDCSHVRCNNSRKWEMIVADFTYQHIHVSYLRVQHTLSHAQSRIWAQQLSSYFFSSRTLAHYTSCPSLSHTRIAGIISPSVHGCTYASLFHTHIHTLSHSLTHMSVVGFTYLNVYV